MSFLTGTQAELLYSMPASGSAVTAAVITVMSGSTAAGTLGITLAKTGTLTTVVQATAAAFDFEVLVTCTAQGVGATAGTLNAVGWVEYGVANNAATGTFGTYSSNNASRFMIGTPQTAVTFNTLTSYYLEVFNTWDATTNAPTTT